MVNNDVENKDKTVILSVVYLDHSMIYIFF